MKNFRFRLTLILSCCILLLNINILSLQAAENPLEINILVPSNQESTIATGRSFYVIGTFNEGTVLPGNAVVNVQILRDNFIYRNIETNVNGNKLLNVNYKGLSYYGKNREDLYNSGMPDLVWDGTNETSFFDGTVKCYYDNHGFAALIPGGTADLDVDEQFELLNSFKKPYLPLSNGNYLINVTIKTEQGLILGNVNKKLTVGSTPNKILARFSPQNHLNRITEFANQNGYRIYLDPFPGYWSKSDLFCEILPSWRACDAVEYLTGTAHFIVYNIKATSSTYSVELPLFQKDNSINNSSRLISYYYAYGEPTLPDVDATVSPFKSFELKDKLQLTRAETTTKLTQDGVYNQDDISAERYDLDIQNGITANPGETLSLYGVTAPIQLADKDIIDNRDNSYVLKNRISTIKYTINAPDMRKIEFEKSIKLTRISGGRENPSEMEFKHDIFMEAEYAGKTLNVTLEAYDAYGKKVKGTKEEFQIVVTKTTELPNNKTCGKFCSLQVFCCIFLIK